MNKIKQNVHSTIHTLLRDIICDACSVTFFADVEESDCNSRNVLLAEYILRLFSPILVFECIVWVTI